VGNINRVVLDPVPRKILETLIGQFDRVAFLLQKETDIQFSPGLLYQMLETYLSPGQVGYLCVLFTSSSRSIRT